MHCKLLLDLGGAARGGSRVAGHAGAFEALSFELGCPAVGEAVGETGSDVELRVALAAGAELQGLQSLLEAATPLVTVDLTLGPLDPETGALMPLVEASLRDARVVAAAAERLVLRGKAATLASLDLGGSGPTAPAEAGETAPVSGGAGAWAEEDWGAEEGAEFCEGVAGEEGLPLAVT